jgi:thiol-disulfide isomerase/thioredoxin
MPDEVVEPVRVGYELPALVVEVAPGRDSLVRFGEGELVILLSFSDSCGHCHTVAPLWKAVMDSVGVRRWFAVSRDAAEVAVAFLSKYELNLPLLRVAPPMSGKVGFALTMMTPWVYVVDGKGVVRYTSSGWALRQALRVADSLEREPMDLAAEDRRS